MVYLLIGGDNYFIKEKIKEIAGDNYYSFSLKKDKDYLLQIESLINQKLFSFPPFIVLFDLDKIEFKDEIFSKISKGNFILIFKTKPQILIKKFIKLGIPYQEIKVENLNFRNERDFKLFLINYLKNKNIYLSEKVINVLAKIFLANPEILLNELKKIEFVKLNQEEILSLIKWPNDSMIFQLVDDLLDDKYSDFILRLKRELGFGNSLNNILSLIYKTLIRIYLLKKAYSVKQENALGLNPYYKEILKRKAQKISEKKINYLIKIVSEIDRKYKKFIINENEAVYYLAELLNSK